MKIYKTDVINRDLVPGDLLATSRSVNLLVVYVSQNCDTMVVVTDTGKSYSLGYDQAAKYKRLANYDIMGLTVNYVFSECFAADVMRNYKEQIKQDELVASLADIPASVLEAALEKRRTHNLIHSLNSKS